MDEVQAIEIVNINPATELSFSQGGGVGQSASRAEKNGGISNKILKLKFN